MPVKQTVEDVEKIFRKAAERLCLPESDPEINEAIKELADALSPLPDSHLPTKEDS